MYKHLTITVLVLLVTNNNLFAQVENNQNLTFKGFDVDTSKINQPSFGMQISTDANFFTFPNTKSSDLGLYDLDLYESQVDDITNKSSAEYLVNKLGWNPALWVRMDLWANVALPWNTNFYSLVALRSLKMDSGNPDDFSYTILNMEVEHYFDKHFKIRFGRLINNLSSSQFYGRIALGGSDAHVFGRTPFVCDAFEVDMNFRDKGLPVFMMGVKPQFNELDFNTFYVGAHKDITQNFHSFVLYSFNKQQEDELTPYLSYIDENRYYSATEAEVAFDNKKLVCFINVGAYFNYIGPAPHYSGARDILKGNEPMVTNSDDSFNQTFIPSIGFTVRPPFISHKLSFFTKASVECEVNSLLDNRLTSYNTYVNLKFKLFKSVNLEYGHNLNLIRYNEPQNFYSSGNVVLISDKLTYGVNYLRLNVVFGKSARQM